MNGQAKTWQKPLAFDVASIKQNRSADFLREEIHFLPGGRFIAKNVVLLYLITEAYDLPFVTTRLEGGPQWIRSDLSAKGRSTCILRAPHRFPEFCGHVGLSSPHRSTCSRRIRIGSACRSAANVHLDWVGFGQDVTRGLGEFCCGVNRSRILTMMNRTEFPATPGEVATLTVQEFTFDLDELDEKQAPSMDRVCRTFMNDANRALVWWIRFGALRIWRARDEVIAGLNAGSIALNDAREVAASFPLNHRWEFEPAEFNLALEAATVRRTQHRADHGVI